VERPFKTNMTAFLDSLPPLGTHPKSSASTENQIEWVGIFLICLSVILILIILLLICCYHYRRRQDSKKAAAAAAGKEIDKEIDTSESEEEAPPPGGVVAESWESEDSAGLNGLAANNATVDVHKCTSATCPQCVAEKGRIKPKFVRLTPRSSRWASLFQMKSPYAAPVSPTNTNTNSPTKKVSFWLPR
jgi:hypothetical protein